MKIEAGILGRRLFPLAYFGSLRAEHLEVQYEQCASPGQHTSVPMPLHGICTCCCCIGIECLNLGTLASQHKLDAYKDIKQAAQSYGSAVHNVQVTGQDGSIYPTLSGTLLFADALTLSKF